MICPRPGCHGFIAPDIDEYNPGNWVYCVNCGWRGDDPSIVVAPAMTAARLVKLGTDERARPMSAEHKANISAARQRYEAMKRQQKEATCASKADTSALSTTAMTEAPSLS